MMKDLFGAAITIYIVTIGTIILKAKADRVQCLAEISFAAGQLHTRCDWYATHDLSWIMSQFHEARVH
jgi:hypothetical protein